MSTFATSEIPMTVAGHQGRAEPWTARSRRLTALAVFAGCTVILGLAAYLTPAPAGHGSHEQLGLPPCGWIAAGDLPCPTCGMTTAFAHAADGNVLAALRAQPLGGFLALAVAMTWLLSIHVMISGSRIGGAFAKLWSTKTAWALSAAVVLAWGYKIALHKGWLS